MELGLFDNNYITYVKKISDFVIESIIYFTSVI